VVDKTLNSLDPGEAAAITLTQTLPADLLIIDERLGRQIACDRGIPIIGTLGILDDAATQGLIDLAQTIAQLQQTNFRVSRRIIHTLLNKQMN
jgi:predicted nucleic acid-binding protein